MSLGHRYNKLHSIKEEEIENYLCNMIDSIGGRAIKGNPRNQRGEADRFCFIPPGITLIVEVKRPGEAPRKNQHKKLEWFRLNGFQATYIDTRAKVDALKDWIANYQNKYRVRSVDQVCLRQDCPMRRNR